MSPSLPLFPSPIISTKDTDRLQAPLSTKLFRFPALLACHNWSCNSLNLDHCLKIRSHRVKRLGLLLGLDVDCEFSSNPASSRYGQHYTAEEIHDIFAPQEKTVKSVSAWLQDSGIAPHRISQSFNKQWLQFDATASEIESLIKTEYYNYAHYGTGKTNIGCDE